MAPHPTPILYESALVFWQSVANVFFREVRPRGAFNIPQDGPVIFVAAPHHNQFLDPLLLTLEVNRETRRRVRFLVAAKSLDMKGVGPLLRIMDGIPVSRGQDYAKPGSGSVSVSEDEPLILRGTDTKFTTEVKVKSSILLPKTARSVSAEVAEIISDTVLKLKKPFSGDGKHAATDLHYVLTKGGVGLSYKVVPHMDTSETFKHVFDDLHDNGCVGIFPEGGSHDQTDLLPLKAGVSMMALGAMAKFPGLKVKLVPVGLSYFAAHRFRSRAVVEFGTPLEVPEQFVEQYKAGGAAKRDAVSEFLELIHDALKTVTVRAPDYDTLMLIQAVRRLYRTPGQTLTLGQNVELNRRFLHGYNHFKDDPRVQALRERVLKYNRGVRDLGLRDHQVPRAKKARWKLLSLMCYRIVLLIVWSTLALPGTVLNAPMFILAGIISKQKQKQALKSSTVKVAGRDVLGSWKVLIAVGVAPPLYTFYCMLATYYMFKKTTLAWYYKVSTPLVVSVLAPLMGYTTLKFGEAGLDVFKSLRPITLALLPGQQLVLSRLKNMRQELSNDVVDMINDLGPKLYDDFDKFRIHHPSSLAPPSVRPNAVRRQKSSHKSLGTQMLNHPMTWIDERLFGWKNTSTISVDSPIGSDGSSDGGDYDHVFSHDDRRHSQENLAGSPTRDGSPSPTSEKPARTRSFKDLQSYRLKASTPISAPSSPVLP